MYEKLESQLLYNTRYQRETQNQTDIYVVKEHNARD